MRLPFLSAAAAGLVGAITVASALLPAPQALLAAAGILMVFFVPGFALAIGLLPTTSAAEDTLLASVGLSLVLATCAAVLLAATRIGLTRESFDITLGGASIGFAILGCVLHTWLAAKAARA